MQVILVFKKFNYGLINGKTGENNKSMAWLYSRSKSSAEKETQPSLPLFNEGGQEGKKEKKRNPLKLLTTGCNTAI